MTEDLRATPDIVLRVATIISELYDPGHVGPACINVAREILEALKPTPEMVVKGVEIYTVWEATEDYRAETFVRQILCLATS